MRIPQPRSVHAGASTRGKASAPIQLHGYNISCLKWQPCSVAAAGSSWLVAGDFALDTHTLDVTTLAPEGWVRWLVWCQDGIHAVLLHVRTKRDFEEEWRIRVWNVASGTLTGSLDCAPFPRQHLHAANMLPDESTAEMLVPSEAQAILVPQSAKVISLCKLPCLHKVAHIIGPDLDGAPTVLNGMGWAARGSLIALAWQAADNATVVTVHAGSDGSLHYTLRLEPHIAEEYDPEPNLRESGFRFVLRYRFPGAFAVCPDLPRAAIAWSFGDYIIHVALIDLANGTQITLKRRRIGESWEDVRYTTWDIVEIKFAWAPGGQHLMVHAIPDEEGPAREDQNWAIFDASSGECCGPLPQSHCFDEPPVWSSQGTLCLVGSGDRDSNALVALDFSAKPPIEKTYFSRSVGEPPIDSGPKACAFVPGSQDLVHFVDEAGPGSPKHGIGSIKHWTYNPSTGSSSCHEVTGFGAATEFQSLLDNIAWHPTLTSAGLYAVSSRGKDASVHLIDAKRHCRLSMWTSAELATILQAPPTPPSLAVYSMKWSPDGKSLAVLTSSSTIILKFEATA